MLQIGLPGYLILDIMVLNRFPIKYKFLFVAVDALTRKISIAFMHILNSRNATNAFIKILEKQWTYWPVTAVFTDEVSGVLCVYPSTALSGGKQKNISCL